MKRILVTSALPYANGPIHIGHLVEYIQTDIFVRFLKLIGKDAIYCCADDTHGTPIEIKSKDLGIKPEELIEKFHKEHLEDFKSFLINFDSYYSTNSIENKEFADKIFLKLKEKDLIYTKEVENFYDEKEKRFLPDRFVKGECPKCGEKDQYGDVCEKCNATYKPIDLVNPYSTISGEKPVRKKSEHYFFKLSKLSDKLDRWLTDNKNLQPEMVNYVRNWIKQGLDDWDISRDGPYFGFKIPGEENKYYYVWLDAPIGYISSTANYCKGKGLDAEEDYWKNKDSEIIHFVGKDIIYFHFLFWPAMLMEAGYNLPQTLVVHGFLTVNGEKMSKSRGTFHTAKDFLKMHNPQDLRYYYAKSLSKKMADIDLDFNDFYDTINNELVANIGNFCYRVLSFIEKNFEGQFNEIIEDNELFDKILVLSEKTKAAYENVNFRDVVKNILQISSLGNKFFQDNEPWKLIKTEPQTVQKIIGTSINIVKNIAILLSPILPNFFETIKNQLNMPELTWDDIHFYTKNHKTSHAETLFTKIEIEKQPTFPLDLKVACILEAKAHPEADKLLVLKIDFGYERRQIVAGLKEYYLPEELIGKNIVVVSNLKPAKLRGVESQGMLLAASSGTVTKILQAPNSKPGDQVKVEGYEINRGKIKYEEFQKIKLVTKDRKVYYDNKELKTNKEDIHVDIDDGFEVR